MPSSAPSEKTTNMMWMKIQMECVVTAVSSLLFEVRQVVSWLVAQASVEILGYPHVLLIRFCSSMRCGQLFG